MKLDATVMRTMERGDFRVLEAVESGMQDHAIVPLPLIVNLAKLRSNGSHKVVSSLLRDKLLSHETKNGMDGYRITNAGYDILALHHLKTRGFVAALGQKIGTGKESDIYLGANKTGKQIVLKFHRLGRTSFRNVRAKRDYFNNRKNAAVHSWLFLSKLSAVKEYAFLTALHSKKYPTPTPIGQNRHVIVMSLVRGLPLYQIYPKQLNVYTAKSIYDQVIQMAVRLASTHYLVHCDLNEFNLIVDLSGIQKSLDDSHDPYVRHSGQSVAPEQSVGALSKPAWEQGLEDQYEAEQKDQIVLKPAELLENGDPKPIVTLIDFPQMISMDHTNAQMYYERDIGSIQRFFRSKLQCTIPDTDPLTVAAQWDNIARLTSDDRLDANLGASGAGVHDGLHNELELYYFESGPRPIASAIEEGNENADEEDDDESSDSDSNNVLDRVPHKKDAVFDPTTDAASIAMSIREDRVEQLSVLGMEELEHLTRRQLQDIAKDRVRKQMTEQKKKQQRRKNGGSGGGNKKNSNKSYVKGKRILTDSLA